MESTEGRTPALGDHQARKLLAAPDDDTLKSARNRAILSTLLFQALRRDEPCKLKVQGLPACAEGRCRTCVYRREHRHHPHL